MRQGQQQQQNRRGRGRGGRKGANPLSRSFESSGPDVKIRGTAQHIAEKYMTLARDAIGSGDLVLGENYLQHAEHYNRIIMAAQLDSPGAANGNGQRVARHDGDLLPGESYDDDDGDDGDGDQSGDNGSGGNGGSDQPAMFDQPNQDQPRFQGNHAPREQRDQPPRDRDQQRFRDRDQGQNRPRDSRPYEPRNFDNRPPREPRQFEPRGDRNDKPDRPYQQRNFENHHRDTRGFDNRNAEARPNDGRNAEPRPADPVADVRPGEQRSFEPRAMEQPRPINGHGEQPRAFEPPHPPVEAVEGVPEAGAAAERTPRPRRRRARHEGAPREFGAADAPFSGDQPAVTDAAPVAPPPDRSSDE
jgi:Domain of unknown function (DUF4167)